MKDILDILKKRFGNLQNTYSLIGTLFGIIISVITFVNLVFSTKYNVALL